MVQDAATAVDNTINMQAKKDGQLYLGARSGPSGSRRDLLLADD